MINDKHSLIKASKELREILKEIEKLLIGYDGINGNRNYINYCRKKAISANDLDDSFDELYNDTYNDKVNLRRGINIFLLLRILKSQFKLLDDIDTAGDIFKPKWCKISSSINELQKNRFTIISTYNIILD